MSAGDDYHGYLFDLDGVIWLGEELIPGAAQAVASLIAAGKEVAFVSNNPRGSAADYARRLGEAGIEVEEERVLTSGKVTAGLAARAAGPGGTAMVIGTDSFRREVAGAGLRVDGGAAPDVAAPDLVVVSGHSGFDYTELRAATTALLGGAKLFATNRDPTMPMPDGPWPGTGSILAAIEFASGTEAVIGGKPERALFDAARAAIGGAGKIVMIGDRIDSDIGGAQAAGLEAILVLSGATSREEAERSGLDPCQIIASAADLIAGGK